MKISPLLIGLFGATGKMGCSFQKIATPTSGITLFPLLRGESPIFVTDDHEKTNVSLSCPKTSHPPFPKPHVLMDFSAPEALRPHLRIALKNQLPFLVGTTGLNDQNEKELRQAALEVPILTAVNTSLGIAVLTLLAEKAATLLGSDFDIEICETHHRYKKDTPSGTAIALGKAMSKAQDIPFLPIFQKEGPRPSQQVGYAVMRGGGVVGDHAIHFLGEDESLTLTHRGFSRDLFCRGALKAAQWLKNQPAGFYSMKDFLSHSFRPYNL